MDRYFQNIQLLQNTLLPYFCNEEPLKLVNKQFYKLNYEKYNTHYQPHGILETYYPDTKTIKHRETYSNGKKDGLYEEWYKNSQLKEKSIYKDGELNGLSEEWYQNGKWCEISNWKNGRQDGLYEYWYPNGQLHLRYNYSNGVEDGLCEEWCENGDLKWKMLI